MEWLTVAEVADELKVSKSTIYSLISRNQLRSHRIGIGRGQFELIERRSLDVFVQGASANMTESPDKEKSHESYPKLRFINWTGQR